VLLQWRSSISFSLSGRDGDSNRFLPSRGIIPNTNPGNQINGPLGHLWYNSGTNFVGPISATLSRATLCQEVQDSNLPLDSCQCPPTHSYYLQSAHFHLSTSGLSRATQLHNRNDLSIQLNVRHAFKTTRRPLCLSP
jgi:hypothetical protein